MKRNVLIVAFLVLASRMTAQDSIPILSGTVNFSIQKGTIECDFTLSNIPRIEDYYIRINSGMNIRYFRNLNGGNLLYYERSLHDTLSWGETVAYYFPGNGGKGKFLPKAIQFRYVGMYPVITDSMSADDWKGNIAFNEYSVRTDGSQSGWYPILYDIKKDIRYDKVKYDIELNCEDCNTLYVNGSVPAQAARSRFKSDLAQSITMYSGQYKVSNVDSTYILNPDITEEQIREFGKMTRVYKSYYEKKLHIPYKQTITYIQTTPTSKDNAWLFVSYPTIVVIGHGDYGMKGLFDKKKGDWFKPYIAHELGHYYFGTYKVFNAELGDMMSEGLSEYLSLKLTKELVSDSIYRTKIKDKLKSLKGFTAIPFAKVKSKTDYGDRNMYVYTYAPIIFVAIEKEIGEENMWKWMTEILQAKTDFTNYVFLEQTLNNVLHNEKTFATIREQYFYSDKSIENAQKAIEVK